MGVTTLTRKRGPAHLGDDQRELYLAQGYLVVEGRVPESFLSAAQQLVEEALDRRVAAWRSDGLLDDEDGGHVRDGDPAARDVRARYRRAWVAAGRPAQNARIDPSDRQRLRAAATQPWLTGVVADVMGVEQVRTLDSCFLRAKLAGDRSTTLPWHQDAQCMAPISGLDFVTAWMPLCDVGRTTSCLEVAPVGPHQRMFEPTWSSTTEYICMRPVDTANIAPTRAIEMCRGDLLLMSPFLPHRTRDVTGEHVRWSVDLRFAPA